MKSLASGNAHLRSAAARKQGVERNVQSSSAIEGVSSAVFRQAADARRKKIKTPRATKN